MTQYLEVTFRQEVGGHVVKAGEKMVPLPPVPAKILLFFMANTGTTHRLRDIINGVYAESRDAQPVWACRATTIQIGILRKKLADEGLHLDLWTEPYKGYEYRGISLIEE